MPPVVSGLNPPAPAVAIAPAESFTRNKGGGTVWRIEGRDSLSSDGGKKETEEKKIQAHRTA